MLPSLSRSWTVAAGSAFFGCLKLRGLGDKFICVESVLWLCCPCFTKESLLVY